MPLPAASAASQPALTVSALSASPLTRCAWPFLMYSWIVASPSKTDVERKRKVTVAPCSVTNVSVSAHVPANRGAVRTQESERGVVANVLGAAKEVDVHV